MYNPRSYHYYNNRTHVSICVDERTALKSGVLIRLDEIVHRDTYEDDVLGYLAHQVEKSKEKLASFCTDAGIPAEQGTITTRISHENEHTWFIVEFNRPASDQEVQDMEKKIRQDEQHDAEDLGRRVKMQLEDIHEDDLPEVKRNLRKIIEGFGND